MVKLPYANSRLFIYLERAGRYAVAEFGTFFAVRMHQIDSAWAFPVPLTVLLFYQRGRRRFVSPKSKLAQ